MPEEKRKIFKYVDNDMSKALIPTTMDQVKKGDYFRIEEPDGRLYAIAQANADAFVDNGVNCVESSTVEGPYYA